MLMAENVHNIKESIKIWLVESKEVRVEVRAEKLSTCSYLVWRMQEKKLK